MKITYKLSRPVVLVANLLPRLNSAIGAGCTTLVKPVPALLGPARTNLDAP